MDEDACPAHRAGLPRALAAIRKFLIGLLRHHGCSKIAQALRHYNAHPTLALALIDAIPT